VGNTFGTECHFVTVNKHQTNMDYGGHVLDCVYICYVMMIITNWIMSRKLIDDCLLTYLYSSHWTSMWFTDFLECDSSPCLNGAICTELVNGYTCVCALGYTDDHCQTGKYLLNNIL